MQTGGKDTLLHETFAVILGKIAFRGNLISRLKLQMHFSQYFNFAVF